MDKSLYNRASPVARSTLNVFLLWTLKGLGSYFVVNLFVRRISETKTLDPPAEYQMGLPCGVLLCIPLPFSDCHRNVQFDNGFQGQEIYRQRCSDGTIYHPWRIVGVYRKFIKKTNSSEHQFRHSRFEMWMDFYSSSLNLSTWALIAGQTWQRAGA